MKKIAILLAAVAMTTFTGCSSSDDGNSTNGNIVAKWNETKRIIEIDGDKTTFPYDDNEAGCDKDFLEFQSEDLGNRTIFYHDGDNVCTSDPGTTFEYQKDGDDLIIGSGYYAGDFTITKLTGNELIFENSETAAGITTTTTYYFTKAAM